MNQEQTKSPEIEAQTAPAAVIDANIPSVEKQESTPENPQERNWKQFREQREQERKQLEQERKQRMEKEKEAAALKAAMEAILNKPSQQDSQKDDFFEEVDDEKRIEALVEKKMQAKEKEFEERKRIQEAQELPNKLNQIHSDFEQVCSTENIDYLEFHYPEITKPYKYMPDSIEKFSALYKAVKKFVPNLEGKKEQSRADKNLAMPKSGSSLSGSQPATHTHSMMLTEQRKTENWERMQRTLKGLS